MIKKWLNHSKKSLGGDFFKHVATLMAGTVAGQVIVFAFTPILSRLFTPDDFTTLEQFTMILSIAVVVITGKYEFAIMHPKEEKDARQLVNLSALLALFGSLVFFVLGCFFSEPIGQYYQNPTLGKYFWMLGPALLGFAIFNITNYWFSRKKQFKIAAVSKVYNSAAGEPIKWLAGIQNYGTLGLLGGTVIGFIIGGIYCGLQYIRDQGKQWMSIEWSRMKAQARIHRDLPLFSIWGSILNRTAQWAHVGIFTHFYGLAAIGLMALCRRVMLAPLNIVSASYSQVFFQRISEMENADHLYKLYFKALIQFLLMASVMVIAVWLLPYNTMGFIFGESWTSSIEYLRLLSFWYAFNFVTASLSFIVIRIQMQRIGLILDALHFVLIYASIIAAHYFNCSEIEAVKWLVIAKVIYFTVHIFTIQWQLQRYVQKAQLP